MEVKTWREILSIKKKKKLNPLWGHAFGTSAPWVDLSNCTMKPDTKLMTQRALSSPLASETYLAHSPELSKDWVCVLQITQSSSQNEESALEYNTSLNAPASVTSYA